MTELVYSYSRADAIRNGEQFQCELAPKAGFLFPVFVTRGINDLIYKSLDYGVNDYYGVMWDLLIMLNLEIRNQKKNQKKSHVSTLPFSILIYWKNDKTRLFDFIAQISAIDIDNPKPAITIMLPDKF